MSALIYPDRLFLISSDLGREENMIRDFLKERGLSQKSLLVQNESETLPPFHEIPRKNLLGESLIPLFYLKPKIVLSSIIKMIEKDEGYQKNSVIFITRNPSSPCGKKQKEKLLSWGFFVEAKTPEIKDLLKEYEIPYKTIAFLETYIGEDKDILSALLNDLEKMPLQKRKALIPQDLKAFLLKEGAFAPYMFLNSVTAGNKKEVLTLLKRCLIKTHPQVLMKMLSNRLTLLYKASLCQDMGVKNIAQALGTSPWVLNKNKSFVQNTALCQKALMITLKAESDMKNLTGELSEDILYKTILEILKISLSSY